MIANLNFITLLTEVDESHNIRLFDGDVVNIPKSDVVMRERFSKLVSGRGAWIDPLNYFHFNLTCLLLILIMHFMDDFSIFNFST